MDQLKKRIYFDDPQEKIFSSQINTRFGSCHEMLDRGSIAMVCSK